MFWIIGIIFLIAAEAFADIFAKKYSITNSYIFAFYALLMYVIANSFWLFALKNGSGLVRGGMIFSVACAVLAVVIGYHIYGESISHTQWIGIFLGLLAMVFLF